ncbi:MAG: ABC transporter permease [Bauldia sp.]
MNQNEAERRPRRWPRGGLEAVRDYAIVGSFVLLFAVLAVSAERFLTPVNLLNTAEAGAIYGVVAIGLTILLIVGEFDLSAGAICVFAGIVAAKLEPSLGAWPSLAGGIVAGIAIGAFNGATVCFARVNSFVATLACSLIVVGLGTAVTNGFQLYIADPAFGTLGNGKVLGVDMFVWIFVAFAAVSGFCLARTRLGRWLYAAGDNPDAARLAGIDVRALRFGAFVFSGFAAGVAGAILISRTGTAIAGAGLADILFPAIAAVVVGGTSIQGGKGAIWRTVLGIFFLELIRNGFNLLEVDPYYQSICQGVIILLAVSADGFSRRTG